MPSFTSHVVANLLSLLALSLALFAYRRSIIPIYGAAPTTYSLNSVVILASLVHPFPISRRTTLLFGAFFASTAPLLTYWVAVWTARWDMPIVGPLVTHLATVWPLVIMLTSLAAEPKIPIGYRVLASLGCSAGGIVLSNFWAETRVLRVVSGNQVFIGLATSFLNLWVATSPTTSMSFRKKKATSPFHSRYMKLALFATLNGSIWASFNLLRSPILPHPLPQPYYHPTFPLVIHSSVQSLTGLIVVGEALPPPNDGGSGADTDMHSMRYLRADHSLLGGVWVGDKVATIDNAPPPVDSFDRPLGDSIYSTFVLHEAARLVNSTSRTAERVAVIGLGVGISPIGFSRHGLSTTIVEIDPAVYDAARLYFGLPEHDDETLFLEDARGWAARRRKNLSTDSLFDIIVHDCFSGGGVPEHIFTIEFWSDLKASLHQQGVLVVVSLVIPSVFCLIIFLQNFAGSIVSDSSRMISQTLLKSFGNCRAFHDAQHQITEAQRTTELVNIVFFCTPHSSPLTFRKARKSDYLNSYLREFILSDLPKREVDFELLTGQLDDEFIIRDDHNLLGELQNNLGHHHWQCALPFFSCSSVDEILVMRKVLPDIFWETF
ncbi:Spermidine synthase [Mycena indigotica]|uniref:Spermidine synthase n=1 Tax=Mycena indigotica TaxID=2126181 RepID=A0A8H6W1C2_9AGAR|nr:Spermidine synthase [Mycena indigotica]KAF7301919.1 Spermidine synthase [Mycena indigotica]